MPRLFVAIEIPEVVKARLTEVPRHISGARWLPPDQIHLTLRFIGEVSDALAADVTSVLGEVHAPTFELALKGAGTFGPAASPRVLWVGVRHSDPLLDLQSCVERALCSLGLAPSRRSYRPHLTLARLKNVHANQLARFIEAIKGQALPPWDVQRFTLFCSTLSPKGATHAVVERYGLSLSA